MTVDPVAFKGASIRPDKLAVAALGEFKVCVGLVLVPPLLSEPVGTRGIRPIEDLHESDLANIPERAEFHHFEAQLTILQTELFILAHAFICSSEQLKCSFRVDTDLSTKLCSANPFFD